MPPLKKIKIIITISHFFSIIMATNNDLDNQTGYCFWSATFFLNGLLSVLFPQLQKHILLTSVHPVPRTAYGTE